MTGLGELFKQIANIDSTLKLIAFLASIFIVTVIVILKYSNRISRRVAGILFFLFGAIFLIAGLGMFLPSSNRTDRIPPPPLQPLTLTLTLTDKAGTPYTSDQANFSVNSKTATVDYSPLARCWTIVFKSGELPKDSSIYLFAQTKDLHFSADTLIRLTDDPVQRLVLRLQGKGNDTPGKGVPVTTFSINLTDGTLRQTLARKLGWTYDQASRKNKIIVTYEEANIQQHSGVYSFVSSCPVVLIDGQKFTLGNHFIPERVPNATRNLQDMKDYVQKEAMAIATTYFRDNPNVLVQWLKAP